MLKVLWLLNLSVAKQRPFLVEQQLAVGGAFLGQVGQHLLGDVSPVEVELPNLGIVNGSFRLGVRQ